jgi:hypothetical protein
VLLLLLSNVLRSLQVPLHLALPWWQERPLRECSKANAVSLDLVLLVPCHISNVLKIFTSSPWSIPPPSGSTASTHRTTAIVCLTSFVLTQTRPFTPTADSRKNREPRKGRRKCFGSSNLFSGDVRRRGFVAWGEGGTRTGSTSSDCILSKIRPSARQIPLTSSSAHQNTPTQAPYPYEPAIP